MIWGELELELEETQACLSPRECHLQLLPLYFPLAFQPVLLPAARPTLHHQRWQHSTWGYREMYGWQRLSMVGELWGREEQPGQQEPTGRLVLAAWTEVEIV